jgi:hypothetical protein
MEAITLIEEAAFYIKMNYFVKSIPVRNTI